MEREACVCDHGFERSDLCPEIIIIIIIIIIIMGLVITRTGFDGLPLFPPKPFEGLDAFRFFFKLFYCKTGRPGSSEVPRNL